VFFEAEEEGEEEEAGEEEEEEEEEEVDIGREVEGSTHIKLREVKNKEKYLCFSFLIK